MRNQRFGYHDRDVTKCRPSTAEQVADHHQDTGSHEALTPICRRGKPAQQLLLAGDHVEPGGDEIVEFLQVAP